MMIRKKILATLILTLTSSTCFALIDYDDQESSNRSFKPKGIKTGVQSVTSQVTPRSSSSGKSSDAYLDFDNSFSVMNFNHQKQTEQFYKMDHQLFIQTSFDFFVDMRYWQAKIKESSTLQQSGADQWQRGNFETRGGLNWLRLGDGRYQTKVNLIGGFRFKEQNSLFATSRNDQMMGIETIKNIGDVVVGLGFEYTITGKPSNTDETRIGNLAHVKGSLGWVATNDIRFSVEAGMVSIAGLSSETVGASSNALRSPITFQYLQPKIHLNLSSFFQVYLGASFRAKPLSTDEAISLSGARLWNVQGLYGNTIMGGVGIGI